MSFRELDSDDFWREPSPAIEAGDVFADMPLLTHKEDDEAMLHRRRLYLPTRRAPFALLLKTLPLTWWFVPILTEESIGHAGLFNDLVGECNRRERPGWFLLPPLESYPPLSNFSIALTLCPTLHRPDFFEDPQAWRPVASLSSAAYENACAVFLEGFSASWE